MRVTRAAAVAAIVLGGLWTAACKDDSGPDNQSKMTLRLTDAAGDIQAAVVTITEIYLQGESQQSVLLSTPLTVNLVDLAQAATTVVNEADVEAGTYNELRFVI